MNSIDWIKLAELLANEAKTYESKGEGPVLIGIFLASLSCVASRMVAYKLSDEEPIIGGTD